MAGQPLKNAWAAEKLSRAPRTESMTTTTNNTPTLTPFVPTTSRPQQPPKSGITIRDDKGVIYLIDPTTNKAYPLQENANIAEPTNEAHFSGLFTDDVTNIVHSSMTPGDYAEYLES